MADGKKLTLEFFEDAEEPVWRDLTFSKKFEMLVPFMFKCRIKFSMTIKSLFYKKTCDKKASKLVFDYLTYLRGKRQFKLIFTNFFYRILVIQERARFQLTLYKDVARDI